MISVSNLVRRFGSFTAVDDISFSLEKGEVVGFLGPNGAGKTTTMRMLTGFIPATRGSITVAGFDVLRDSLEVRRRIGYLSEAVPLYREHRVEEMLMFQARLHSMPRADAIRRSSEVLERVGMTERRRSLVGKLSKGQRQRVGIAVALLHDPEVLILDEPTSGLDPLQRIEVRQLIGDLAQDRTVLLSSHILPEIEAVCARVILLQRGRIVADGSQEQLVRELGGATFVRLEAVVPDAAEAQRLLATLPGVTGVEDRGALGIHRSFDVAAATDVREDVGALAAARGWALRELSFRRPTLEELFARVALDLDPDDDVPVALGSPRAPETAAPKLEIELPQLGQPSAPKAGGYNLNPFEASGFGDTAPEKSPECEERE